MTEVQVQVHALKGRVVSRGMEFPEGMTYEEWAAQGKLLKELALWIPWALADWLNYGTDHYPDRYTQAVEVTGLSPQTLYNKTYIGRLFPPGERSEKLTVGHHEALIPAPPERRQELLEKLEKEEEKLAKNGGHITVPQAREWVKEQIAPGKEEGAEVVPPPPACGVCDGHGLCKHCHGSGIEPRGLEAV